MYIKNSIFWYMGTRKWVKSATITQKFENLGATVHDYTRSVADSYNLRNYSYSLISLSMV